MEEINTIRCNRIVGKPERDCKIFIEDYVKSYISRLSQDNRGKGNIEILFGKFKTDGKKLHLDVNGAATLASAEKIGLGNGNQEKGIESLNIKYFPELEPVGWFYNLEESEKIDYSYLMNLHEELFGENEGILILPGDGSPDPEIYSYSGDGFRKHKGYVIYYEKNPEMQEYLLSRSRIEEEIHPGRDVVSSLREKINGGNVIKQRIVSLPGKVKDRYKDNSLPLTDISQEATGEENNTGGGKFTVKTGLMLVGVLGIILAGLLLAFKKNYYTNMGDTIECVKEFIRYYSGESGFAFAKWKIYDIICLLGTYVI